MFGSGAGFADFFAGVVVAGFGAGLAFVEVVFAGGVCAAGFGAVVVAVVVFVVDAGGVAGLTGTPLRRFIACGPVAAGATFVCAVLPVAVAPVAGFGAG